MDVGADWTLYPLRHNSSNVGSVTAGQARQNSSNVGSVTAGRVRHKSSIALCGLTFDAILHFGATSLKSIGRAHTYFG